MNDKCIQSLKAFLLLFIMPNTQSTRGASSEGARLIVKCNHTHLAGNGMQGVLFLYFQATNNVSQCLMASFDGITSFNGCGLDPDQVSVKTGGISHWFIKVDIHNVMQQNVGLYQCIWKENTDHGAYFARAYETEKMEFNLNNAMSHFRFTLNDSSRIVTLDMNFTPNQPACESCWTRHCVIISVVSISLVITVTVCVTIIRDNQRAKSIKQKKNEVY